jgi:predicted acylesterase/phospholipase RssA
MTEVDESRRVALALGSGGARGYAHIGMIQVLEERGFTRWPPRPQRQREPFSRR